MSIVQAMEFARQRRARINGRRVQRAEDYARRAGDVARERMLAADNKVRHAEAQRDEAKKWNARAFGFCGADRRELVRDIQLTYRVCADGLREMDPAFRAEVVERVVRQNMTEIFEYVDGKKKGGG